jgi:streptomycin 6-kinase
VNELALEIPEPVRLKALSIGRAGEAWLAGLAGVVADLEAGWDLSIGRTLSGGTEAFVAEVTMADGRKAVLKVSLPGRDPSTSELSTLLAGRGRGYAEVYGHDQRRKAMLLERLGPKLSELGWSVDAQIEAICATLRVAWTPLPEGSCFTTGAEKARSLGDFIETTWRELGRPCPERTVKMALRYAEVRHHGFDPDLAVLAHGDAHAWNTLLVPGDGSARFKFVDPMASSSSVRMILEF